MDNEVIELQRRLSDLEKMVQERFQKYENEVNDLFFSLLGYKLRKPLLEEVVRMAVIEYFDADQSQFLGRKFPKRGPAVAAADPPGKAVIEARKWFLSIVTYALHRTPHPLSQNYPFYHSREVSKHASVFMGALEPKCAKDEKNREIYESIVAIIKRICSQEGVLCDEFVF